MTLSPSPAATANEIFLPDRQTNFDLFKAVLENNGFAQVICFKKHSAEVFDSEMPFGNNPVPADSKAPNEENLTELIYFFQNPLGPILLSEAVRQEKNGVMIQETPRSFQLMFAWHANKELRNYGPIIDFDKFIGHKLKDESNQKVYIHTGQENAYGSNDINDSNKAPRSGMIRGPSNNCTDRSNVILIYKALLEYGEFEREIHAWSDKSPKTKDKATSEDIDVKKCMETCLLHLDERRRIENLHVNSDFELEKLNLHLRRLAKMSELRARLVDTPDPDHILEQCAPFPA